MPISTAGTNGFTLLELLVVLAIVALVLGIIPTLFSGSSSLQVRSAVQQIRAGLGQTRLLALQSRQAVPFTVDVTNSRFRVAKRAWQDLSANLPLQLYTAADQQITGHQGSIDFFPDGSASGGYLAIGQGGQTFRVNVDWLTGRIWVNRGQ